MQWNSELILNTILEKVDGVSSVQRTGKGEDYTTEQIRVSVRDSEHAIWVRGFVTNGQRLPQDDNVDIELVEVTTGFSDGDMPQDTKYILAHAAVRATLVMLGYNTVQSMDGYF